MAVMKTSTEHDYHRRIARVIEAILEDPAAPHTVESLASVANLSPFHFHRIYRALTGEGLAETVQRLRLARAARRLNDAGASVTEVALDAGYESPQAFARAFRGFAGLSPREFQVRQRVLSSPSGAGDSADVQPSQRTENAAPRVDLVDLAPVEVLCLPHKGPAANISQTFRKLLLSLYDDHPSRNGVGQIGIGYGDPEQPSGFRYLAAVVTPRPINPVPGLRIKTLEGGLYAMHRLVGPYALIAPTFQVLFGGWLPRSGYLPDDRPALEFYRSAPQARARNDFVTDLMIPVREG